MTGRADQPLAETKSAFARRLGVRASYVTALAAAGRLVLTVDGRVDVPASLARIDATRDPAKEGVRARHAQGRDKRRAANPSPVPLPPEKSPAAGQETPPGGAATPPDGEDPTTAAFRRFQAVKMHYSARHAAIRLARKQGRLADVAAIAKSGLDAGAGLRSQMENLPDQAAPRLAPEKDPAACAEILGRLLDGIAERFAADTARHAAALRKTEAP